MAKRYNIFILNQINYLKRRSAYKRYSNTFCSDRATHFTIYSHLHLQVTMLMRITEWNAVQFRELGVVLDRLVNRAIFEVLKNLTWINLWCRGAYWVAWKWVRIYHLTIRKFRITSWRKTKKCLKVRFKRKRRSVPLSSCIRNHFLIVKGGENQWNDKQCWISLKSQKL